MDISQPSVFAKQLEKAYQFQRSTETPVSKLSFTAEEIKRRRNEYLSSRYVHIFKQNRHDTGEHTKVADPLSSLSRAHQIVHKFIIKLLEKYLINTVVRSTLNAFLTNGKIRSLLAKEKLESQLEARDKIIKRLKGQVHKVTNKRTSKTSSADLIAIETILNIVSKFDDMNKFKYDDTQQINDIVQKAIFQKRFHKTYFR